MKFKSNARWNSFFLLAVLLLIGANAWSACDAEHQKYYLTAQEVSRKWSANFTLSIAAAPRSEESTQLQSSGKSYADKSVDDSSRLIESEKSSVENCLRSTNQRNVSEQPKLRNAFLMTGTQYRTSMQAYQPTTAQPNALLAPSHHANRQDQFVPNGALIWPNDNPGPGINNWGFSRPSGCQADLQYVMPLSSKIKAEWFAGQGDNPLRNLRNEFVSGRLADMIMNGRGDPAAARRLQDDITSLTQQYRTAVDEAKRYGQLTAEGEASKSVAERMQSFTLPMSCTGMPDPKNTGAANYAACGVGAKMLWLTATYERFVQIACHLGLNTPGSSGRRSSLDITDESGNNQPTVNFTQIQ